MLQIPSLRPNLRLIYAYSTPNLRQRVTSKRGVLVGIRRGGPRLSLVPRWFLPAGARYGWGNFSLRLIYAVSTPNLRQIHDPILVFLFGG